MKKIIFLVLTLLLVGCLNQNNLTSDKVNNIDGKVYYKNKLYTGKVNTYENNILKITTTYKNGIKDGIQESFYENGKKQTIYTYKNDQLDGEIKYINENGILIYHLNYKNGILNGEYKVFHENGDLWKQANFVNGEVIGEVTVFDKEIENGISKE